jgi:hypothetical protein
MCAVASSETVSAAALTTFVSLDVCYVLHVFLPPFVTPPLL